MQLFDLQLFCDLVEMRSFTKAAKKNCLTQSAVSQRINRLSDYYGQSLFVDRKKFLLSMQGRYIYEKYKDILKLYAAADRIRYADRIKEFISIGFCKNAKQRYFHRGFIDRILENGLFPEIYFGFSQNIFEKVIFGALDYGIVGHTPELTHDLIARCLYSERIVLVAGLNCPTHVSSLEDIPLLLDHRDSGLYRFLKDEMGKLGKDLDSFNIQGYIGTSIDKLELLSRLGFYGFVPESYLEGNQDLKIIDLDLELNRCFYEIYMKKNREKVFSVVHIIKEANKVREL